MVGVIERGEVWVANLNPNRGAEVGKIRPVVVIQTNELSVEVTNTVIVLPTTTRSRPGLRRMRVSLPARGRLRLDCQVMVDQPRTLDRRRIGEGPLTKLTESEMAQIEESLQAMLGMV